MILSTSLK